MGQSYICTTAVKIHDSQAYKNRLSSGLSYPSSEPLSETIAPKNLRLVLIQDWLVGCFGFNGPLRQYFSLYRAVSQREGERRERLDESKNVQTTPTRTYCKRNRSLPYCNQNCRTPQHWKFTQHHRTTRPPPLIQEGQFSYWRKYVHEVLVNRLGSLGLSRKNVVRLTDCPDMTFDIYGERKTTTQQQQ